MTKQVKLKVCSVEGCNRPHYAKTFCVLHYERTKRGSTEIKRHLGHWHKIDHCQRFSKKDSSVWAKFLCRFIPGKDDACWEWPGCNNTSGYGSISISGHSYLAHRLSYAFFRGEFDSSLFVLHKCDNRKCVNPNHLFLGTNLDNIRDAVAKGRNARGNKIHHSKLTEEIVHAIRTSDLPSKDLAKMFLITSQHVGAIKAKRQWTWLKDLTPASKQKLGLEVEAKNA